MNKHLKIIDLQAYAMLNGDHIIGDEVTVVSIKTTGVKVYTTARNAGAGFA